MLTIKLTEKETGTVVAALRTLQRDHEARAATAQKEAREIHAAAPHRTEWAIAEKMATDQASLAGQVAALLDRFTAEEG